MNTWSEQQQQRVYINNQHTTTVTLIRRTPDRMMVTTPRPSIYTRCRLSVRYGKASVNRKSQQHSSLSAAFMAMSFSPGVRLVNFVSLLCASVTKQYNLLPAKGSDLFCWISNRDLVGLLYFAVCIVNVKVAFGDKTRRFAL